MDETIAFEPYDANQLIAILKSRAEKAFQEDVLAEDVIPLCAVYAAQDKGDARQALKLLLKAGKFANNEDAGTVTEEHVRAAQDEVTKDMVAQGVRDLTEQSQIVLCALCCLKAEGRTPARTKVGVSNV